MAERKVSDDNANVDPYYRQNSSSGSDSKDSNSDGDDDGPVAKRARVMTAEELQTVAAHVPQDTWNTMDMWVTGIVTKQQRDLMRLWRDPPKVVDVPIPPPDHLARNHETQYAYAHVLDKLMNETRQEASKFHCDDDNANNYCRDDKELALPTIKLQVRWSDETRDQATKFFTLAHAQFRRVIELGIPRQTVLGDGAAASSSAAASGTSSASPVVIPSRRCILCNSNAIVRSCWCHPVTRLPIQRERWGGLDLMNYGDWLLEFPRMEDGALLFLDSELGGARGFRFFGTTNKDELEILCDAVCDSHECTNQSPYKSRSNPEFVNMFEAIQHAGIPHYSRARVVIDNVTYQEVAVFQGDTAVVQGTDTRHTFRLRMRRHDWVYRHFTCNYGKFARTLQRAFRARQARCRLNHILASTSLSADVASSIIVQDYLS